eukprot:727763-Pyramimonas_sp.AAC.1
MASGAAEAARRRARHRAEAAQCRVLPPWEGGEASGGGRSEQGGERPAPRASRRRVSPHRGCSCGGLGPDGY